MSCAGFDYLAGFATESLIAMLMFGCASSLQLELAKLGQEMVAPLKVAHLVWFFIVAFFLLLVKMRSVLW